MNKIDYQMIKKKQLTQMSSSGYISRKGSLVSGSRLSYSSGLVPFMKKVDYSCEMCSSRPITGVNKNTVHQHLRIVRSGGPRVPIKKGTKK